MDIFPGRRLSNGLHLLDSEAGDYWRTLTGVWEARDPRGAVVDLSEHEVVEHEDGTITISPSRVRRSAPRVEVGLEGDWYGFLERGVWRETGPEA